MTKLEIYVAEECWACEESRRIAAEVARRYPAVNVVLVDMETPGRPSNVFAAPTYVLDGKVISLGNPTRDDLAERLERVQTVATSRGHVRS